VIVEKCRIASNLDRGKGGTGLHGCRDRDETLRMKARLGSRFLSKGLDSFTRNPNVNESHASTAPLAMNMSSSANLKPSNPFTLRYTILISPLVKKRSLVQGVWIHLLISLTRV